MTATRPLDELENPADPRDDPQAAPPHPSRRSFLGSVTTAAVAAGTVSFVPGAGAQEGEPVPANHENPGVVRANRALKIRRDAAQFQRSQPLPNHRDNGDEDRYRNRIGSYSKGLPHDALGEVDPGAYDSFLTALRSGRPDDFERIVLGGTARLTNPQAGLAFGIEGSDAAALTQKAAPAFSSAEEAGEMAENYWMALTRDVSFSDYAVHPLTLAAAADLSRMSDFRGPKVGGQVTPQTLFRGGVAGDTIGPYLSQFMLQETPFGAELVERRMRCPIAGDDYMTDYAEWLAVQNGTPAGLNQFDDVRRYIRNGRDLGEWVHIDVLFQGYFNALLILFRLGLPFDPHNPYNSSRTQIGFGTLGPPYMASVLAAVAREALKAVWHQKWFVHRRLRPEVFGGRVHNHRIGAARYPIHRDILESPVLDEVAGRFGTSLLPMGFPEGSPTHPAYGAGHATVAGACVTVLKALFDESAVVPDPVVAGPDGLSLVPFSGPDLTVGHELNKLAANVSVGRNIAGVHWRSDATESLKLGEDLAIRFLRDERRTFNESFRGFSIKRFDGRSITI